MNLPLVVLLAHAATVSLSGGPDGSKGVRTVREDLAFAAVGMRFRASDLGYQMQLASRIVGPSGMFVRESFNQSSHELRSAWDNRCVRR